MTLWTKYGNRLMRTRELAGPLLGERRGTPSYELEDLEYYAERLQHSSRSPHVSFSSDQGFIQGLEEVFMQDYVLKPWVLSEVIAVVQAYMLSQMPRYWAGCEPDVEILEEVRSD